jgi:hypothetical protein
MKDDLISNASRTISRRALLRRTATEAGDVLVLSGTVYGPDWPNTVAGGTA